MANEPQKRPRAQQEATQPQRNRRNHRSGKYSKKPKHSISIAAVVAVCVAIIAITAGIIAACFFLTCTAEEEGEILPNVTVAGVDVGGMTKEVAIHTVKTAIGNTYAKKNMVVQVEDAVLELTPSVSGVSLDVAAAVNAAYAYGHTGTAQQQQQELNNAMRYGYAVDLAPYLSVNTKAIEAKLQEFGTTYSTTLKQSSYEITGQLPDLSESAQEAEGMTLVVTIGTPEYSLDLKALYQKIVEAYQNNTFQVMQECPMILPEKLDMAAILEGTGVEPVDATMDPKTFEIQEGSYGYGLDPAIAQALVDAADYGTTLELPFTRIPPEVRSTDLSGVLFRDVLGSYTATSSSNPDRDQNLAKACQSINGIVLMPGDSFSYNQTLGERTEANGYRPGASYAGGETVYTIGGGICQVSSSLYYCTLLADLEIIERECHGFAPSYMRLGTDATVNWGTLDFVFRNSMDYPIRIEATASGGSVTVKILGTDDRNYYVEVESELLKTYSYTTTYKEMSADNKDGYKDGDEIVSPYTGYDVKTYRCRYNKETKELISKEYEDTSNYRKRDAVICKIVGNSGNSETTAPTTGNVSDNPGLLPPE